MSSRPAPPCAHPRGAPKSTAAGEKVARLDSTALDLGAEPGAVPLRLADDVARHAADLIAAYHPEGSHQVWLLNQAADAAARIDHCQIMMRAHHDDLMDRADLCWDLDRELAVEELAARLPKDPARVAHRLRSTAHGAFWLLARWRALADSLARDGGWDEPEIDRAFHLLGLGPDSRDLHPYLVPGGNPEDFGDLAAEQIRELTDLLADALEPLNAKDRELTRLGMPLRPPKELQRLQREETRLRRVLNESMAEFHRLRAEGHTASVADCGLRIAESAPVTAPEPEPAAGPPARSSIPQSAIGNPQSKEPLPPSPIPQSAIRNPQLEPSVEALTTMVDEVQSRLSEPSAPGKTTRTPPPPKADERKARRQRQKAARKKARSH